MSDLIERTARAMCVANHGDPDEDMSNDGPRWKYWEPNARAAIAAVAEWIGEHHQIDKDGSVGLALTWQYTAKSAPPPPEVK